MTELQREFFDELMEEKKKEKRGPFHPPEKEVSFSSSLDTLLLGFLLLLMAIVIIYAVGVEVGRRHRIPRTPPLQITKSTKPIDTTQRETWKYTVQIASFTKKEPAERALGKLKKERADGFLVSEKLFYALCVGKHETRAEADRVLSTLQKQYKDAFVRNR